MGGDGCDAGSGATHGSSSRTTSSSPSSAKDRAFRRTDGREGGGGVGPGDAVTTPGDAPRGCGTGGGGMGRDPKAATPSWLGMHSINYNHRSAWAASDVVSLVGATTALRYTMRPRSGSL